MRSPSKTILLLLLIMASCQAPIPPKAVAIPDSHTTPTPTPPTSTTVPNAVRAALVNAEPQEYALAASPKSSAADIKRMRQLHANVADALAAIKHAGRHHVTPVMLARAKSAVSNLQHYVRRFQSKAVSRNQP